MITAESEAPMMFRADAYVAEAPHEIVKRYPFANLISPQMHATCTPIVFERDGDFSTLVGHMAARGAHALAMRSDDRALAIFMGPHAYISPRWYVEKPEVPTWNYVAAHVRGRLTMIDDEAGKFEVLRRTVEVVEADFGVPWTLSEAPDGRIANLAPMIRAFRIHIEKVEGTTKLSQTHPLGDRVRIIEGLKHLQDESLADIMQAMVRL